MKNLKAFIVIPTVSLLATAVGQAQSTILLDDDLDDLSNFTSVTHGASIWSSNGTDAIFSNGTNGGNRASLRSSSFDFSPFAGTGQTIVLEFTTTISDIDPGLGVNRFEVALVTSSSVANYDQPLAFETNVEGFSFTHTANFNPAGLFFNDAEGGRPGTGANDIPSTAVAGTHTIRLEFNDTRTELFFDGVSQGTDTTNLIDFNDEYTINVFAQDPANASDRSLDNITLSVGFSFNEIDMDNDNLPDEWEELFFPGDLTQLNGTATGPGSGAGSGDFDGDGLRDIDEFNNSGNPTLVDSDLDTLTDLEEFEGSLNPYQTGHIAGNPPGGVPGASTMLNIPDSDGDGVNDGQEVNGQNSSGVSHGFGPTNPNDGDSDGDGLPDDWEINNMIDPTDDGGGDENNGEFGDPDGDNLDNTEEFMQGTNPQQADTDGDGLNDDEELFQHNTNPLLADTDNDGLDDQDELNGTLDDVAHGFGPTDPLIADVDEDGLGDGDEIRGSNSGNFVSNPIVLDTDMDGFNDGFEVLRNSNPDDSNSLPGTGDITIAGMPNASFGGLLGWWDASDASTFTFLANNEVETWTDKSNAGRVATINGGMSITRDPFLNGTSTVTLTGENFFTLDSDLILPLAPPLGLENGNVSAFVVARTFDQDDNYVLLSREGQNVQFFRQNRATDIRFFKGSQPDGRVEADAANVTTNRIRYAALGAADTNTILEYAVDGTDLPLAAPGGGNDTDWVLNTIGGSILGGPWNGEIAEILLYDHALTANEEEQVGLYLAAKYGIATTYGTSPSPSDLAFTSIVVDAARNVTLEFTSEEMATYTLEVTTDLMELNWQVVDNAVPAGAGTSTTYNYNVGASPLDPANEVRLFFRVTENE